MHNALCAQATAFGIQPGEMSKKLFERYVPSPAELRANPALKPLGNLLHNKEIWHFHRRSVAGAAFIGLFCAFLPVPFQMVVAALLAVVARCNLPISVALVWITNPITIPPMFYFTYRLGAWLLNMEIEVDEVELSWAWLSDNISHIGYPLVFGSLVCGWVSGVTAFVIVRVAWRLHVVKRWRERRERRRAAKRARDEGATKPSGATSESS